jgi:hypothetical protein
MTLMAEQILKHKRTMMQEKSLLTSMYLLRDRQIP